jgi:hypothetical protein
MLSDMQTVYESLARDYNQNHLIVYGRSLGSGFAAKVASDNLPRYLILDAPYYNFRKVLNAFFLSSLSVSYYAIISVRTNGSLK